MKRFKTSDASSSRIFLKLSKSPLLYWYLFWGSHFLSCFAIILTQQIWSEIQTSHGLNWLASHCVYRTNPAMWMCLCNFVASITICKRQLFLQHWCVAGNGVYELHTADHNLVFNSLPDVWNHLQAPDELICDAVFLTDSHAVIKVLGVILVRRSIDGSYIQVLGILDPCFRKTNLQVSILSSLCSLLLYRLKVCRKTPPPWPVNL